jgi:hypothetical protein
MSLNSLHALSLSIIHSAITHPLGFIRLSPSTESPFTAKERKVLDLDRELDDLARQIVQTREEVGLPEKRGPPNRPN